jgi:2-keto-4-pentenoate hydratase
MTNRREAVLFQTADTLLNARRTGNSIDNLPPNLVPTDIDEVYIVQDNVAAAYGPIGGWKIGAPSPDATPLFAPMPAAWIAPSGSTLTGDRWRYRGLEAEIAFLVGKDLPPRNIAAGEAPYTRKEVLAAIASCHPAIEILESAFTDPMQATKFSSLADLQIHGGFVYGPPVPKWQTIDFTTERVTLTVDSVLRVDRTGSNTSGDLLKLLPWLANHGATRTAGLRAGQWITTGSWTGNTPSATSTVAEVHFTTAGRVDFRFDE